jgi:tetratricopeptide (TPR) repeat protein
MPRRPLLVPAVALLAAALHAAPAAAQQEPVEAVSLLGDSLRRPPLAPAARARMEAQLDSARAVSAAAPRSADALIWVARRLGYLGRFREAIDLLSRGAAEHPDDPWIYRHRGHRYLTVRDFRRATADLERAARLTRGKPDVVEPDGQPNVRNQPIGTLQSNTYYHLALAHYFQGDYAKALAATTEGMRLASNPDRLVSQVHWHYLALRRLGRHDEARRALAPVRRDLDVFENGNYHRLTLFYKGELPADSLLAPGAPIATSGDAAVAYGLGAWQLAEGRRDEAIATFRRILASGQWPSFGYVAAEVDLKRLGAGASGTRGAAR